MYGLTDSLVHLYKFSTCLGVNKINTMCLNQHTHFITLEGMRKYICEVMKYKRINFNLVHMYRYSLHLQQTKKI